MQRGPISARASIAACANLRRGIDASVASGDGRWMDARADAWHRVEQRRYLSPAGNWVRNDQPDCSGREVWQHVGGHEHRTGTRLRKSRCVAAVSNKVDLVRSSKRERGKTRHEEIALGRSASDGCGNVANGCGPVQLKNRGLPTRIKRSISRSSQTDRDPRKQQWFDKADAPPRRDVTPVWYHRGKTVTAKAGNRTTLSRLGS